MRMEIKINIKHNENFTASSLMRQYAKDNNIPCVHKDFVCCLVIKGEYYIYDHWQITPCEDAPEYDTVTLYLIKKEQ